MAAESVTSGQIAPSQASKNRLLNKDGKRMEVIKEQLNEHGNEGTYKGKRSTFKSKNKTMMKGGMS